MSIVNCLICEKTFYAKPSRLKQGFSKFCSKNCFDLFQRANPKIGDRSQRWNSVERNCKTCGKKFFRCPAKIKLGRGVYCSKICYTKGMVGLNLGIKRSKETIAKFSGKNHYNWKGGVNYQYRKRFKNTTWELLKKQIYDRDNRVCQNCGKVCNYMDISCHHIEPWRVSKNDSPNNLITLCRSCHAKADMFGINLSTNQTG